MAGVRVTPEQAQAKWLSRIQASTQQITDGVARVSVAPGQQAAAKSAKWLQNVTASADKWKRNVGAVSLSDWQNLMTTVGIPRISQGAAAKQAKYGSFATQFFAHLNNGLQTINAMPDTQFEDRVAKAVAMMRWNHKFVRSGTSNLT